VYPDAVEPCPEEAWAFFRKQVRPVDMRSEWELSGVQHDGGLLYCLVPVGYDMLCERGPNGAYMHSWGVMKRGL
jgi:hypothetical protein